MKWKLSRIGKSKQLVYTSNRKFSGIFSLPLRVCIHLKKLSVWLPLYIITCVFYPSSTEAFFFLSGQVGGEPKHCFGLFLDGGCDYVHHCSALSGLRVESYIQHPPYRDKSLSKLIGGFTKFASSENPSVNLVCEYAANDNSDDCTYYWSFQNFKNNVYNIATGKK